MYISPVDILGISVDELMNLDAQGLIRLEKRLKIQKLQNKSDTYNPQQFDALLAQLTDVNKKRSISFVEQHPRLKKFITTGKDEGVKTFIIDERILNDAPHIKEFLAPYFDAYFMRMVKQDYQANKYDTIIKALKYKALFTDQLLTKYYEYIKGQIEIVVEKIVVARKGQLASSCPQITYKTFVELMNTVPLGFIKKTKVAYVNALVDYYNSTLNKHREYSKIQRAFRNVIFIDIGDQDLIAYFKQLSNQIANTSPRHESASESSTSSAWRSVAIIIGIVVFIAKVSRTFSGSSNYTPSNNSTINFPSIKITHDEDKTAFYSDLIHKADDTIFNGTPVNLVTKKNVFPLQFENIREGNINSYKNISILNNRTNPLILFLQANASKNNSGAISIAANDTLSIRGLSKNSVLVFYSGDVLMTVGNKGFTVNRGKYSIKPSKKYFNRVSETEFGWLKNKYIIDSVGVDPKIELVENELNFYNISYHTEVNEILPEEPDEVEETVIESRPISVATKEAWKKPKHSFFKSLVYGHINKEANTTLVSGSNPYPNSFKGKDHSSITGYDVKVYNDSDEDLILFSRNLSLLRDQAVFVAKKQNTSIRLHDQNDTLRFYKGSDFYKIPANNLSQKGGMPEGYFSASSTSGINLLKQQFIVQELGADPNIQVSNTDVFLNQIEHKVE